MFWFQSYSLHGFKDNVLFGIKWKFKLCLIWNFVSSVWKCQLQLLVWSTYFQSTWDATYPYKYTIPHITFTFFLFLYFLPSLFFFCLHFNLTWDGLDDSGSIINLCIVRHFLMSCTMYMYTSKISIWRWKILFLEFFAVELGRWGKTN